MVVVYCMWCFAFIGLICIALICLFDCVIEISFGFWLRDIYNKGYMSRTCSSIVIKYRIFLRIRYLGEHRRWCLHVCEIIYWTGHAFQFHSLRMDMCDHRLDKLLYEFALACLCFGMQISRWGCTGLLMDKGSFVCFQHCFLFTD